MPGPGERPAERLVLQAASPPLPVAADGLRAPAEGLRPDPRRSHPSGTTRKPVFHGWTIVGAGGVIQGLVNGLILQAFGSYGVLLERQFGWSKTTISLAYSFNRVESGLFGPVQGWAIDRFGSKTVMRVGVVTLTVGFTLFSLIQSPAQFIGAFLVMAIGASLAGFLTITTDIVRWFEYKRARALAVTMVGFALGGAATPAVVWALRTFGWRTTAFASGLAVFVIAYPLTGLFGSRPADRGQFVDGIDPGAPAANRRRALGVSDVHFTAGEALRTRAFWMISLGHASALLVVGAVIAHLSFYLTTEHGLDLQEASFVAAGLTAFQLVGMLATGIIGDRVSKRLLVSVAMLGHTAGLLVLTLATSTLMIWLFVVLHGMAWGARGPLMGAIRADYFGSTAYGTIMGFSSLVVMFGAVGGPLFAGFLADSTGSYYSGFTILALLAGVGVLFFAFAAPPAPPSRGPGRGPRAPSPPGGRPT